MEFQANDFFSIQEEKNHALSRSTSDCRCDGGNYGPKTTHLPSPERAAAAQSSLDRLFAGHVHLLADPGLSQRLPLRLGAAPHLPHSPLKDVGDPKAVGKVQGRGVLRVRAVYVPAFAAAVGVDVARVGAGGRGMVGVVERG